MKQVEHYPSLAELRSIIRKPSYDLDKPTRAMWYIRPFQVYVTWLLIRLRVGAIQTTVIWFLVSLLAYATMCLGTPWAFVVGAAMIYVQIVLDGVDGELARYQKQYVSAEKDMLDWIHGIYLDKSFHVIGHPLWSVALGIGLYRLTQDPWVWAATVSLTVFASFTRFDALVKKQLPNEFRDRIAKVVDSGGFEGITTDSVTADSIPTRIMDKLDLWLRNGKRANLVILVCALLDWALLSVGHGAIVLHNFFLAAGALCPVLVAWTIIRTTSKRIMVREAYRLSKRSQ